MHQTRTYGSVPEGAQAKASDLFTAISYTQNYLENKLSIMMGGRCAEKLQFEEVSSGAADDLKQATLLARRMITQWGMSKRLGAINLQQTEEHPFLGREIAEPKKFSEHSAKIVDDEIGRLLARCENNSLSILEKHHTALSTVAQLLLDRETISGADLAVLLQEK